MSTRKDLDQVLVETEHAEVPLKVDSGEDLEAPPAYTSDPPPKYEELIQKVKDARDKSTGYSSFLLNLFAVLFCETVCCVTFIVIMLAIPLAMIAIGSVHIQDCPRERFIPIYLVVGGVFGVIKAFFNMATLIYKRRTGAGNDKEDSPRPRLRSPNPVNAVLNCFLLVWFVAGCVWVYSARPSVQFDDATARDTYCHRTVFLFSFWTLTLQLALLGLILFCGCIFIIGTCFSK